MISQSNVPTRDYEIYAEGLRLASREPITIELDERVYDFVIFIFRLSEEMLGGRCPSRREDCQIL